MPLAAHNSRAHRRGAISLLETTIALGILGVGLIMVAAVFPVALSEHRDVTDHARSIELAGKAQALLRSRVDTDYLWVPSNLSHGEDTPWFLLPTTNLAYQAKLWDWMPAYAPPSYSRDANYANVINGVTDTDYAARNSTLLTGLDTLSDRRGPFSSGLQTPPSPFTDTEFSDLPNRLVWYGFYRRLAGNFSFCAAICRQQRNQIFLEQDLTANAVDTTLAASAQNPYSTPIAVTSSGRRLPVPWRVSVGCASPNILFNTQTAPMLGAGLPLGRLAPPGTRIMIQGAVHEQPAASTSPITVPTGRILTVADVLNDSSGNPTVVEILGDIQDLPLFNYATGKTVTFDVWLFPPGFSGTEPEKTSPLLEWKSLL